MGGLFDSLGIAGSALLTAQYGGRLSGHNIANATTPGFHRRDLLLASVGPETYGVKSNGVQRAADGLLSNRLNREMGDQAFAETRSGLLDRIESAVAETGDAGLTASLDRFFNGWRQLSAAPDEPTVRAQALARTEDLVARIQRAANDLDRIRSDVDSELVIRVDEANGLIDEVATLNRSILEADSAGADSGDLRDRRDTAVRSLSDLVGSTSFEDKRGHVTVLVAGGISVVQGDATRHLRADLDPASGNHTINAVDGTPVDVTSRLRSGRMAALLEVRDQDLVARQAELDTFAYDLASAVNAQHVSNVGLDGVAGRNLFAPLASVTDAARTLAVDAAVAGQSANLGAALDAAALPGDGRGADAIVQIESAMVTGGGQQTLSGSLLGILGDVGQVARQASDVMTLQSARLEQVENLHESVVGISIEEQMLMLTRYQRAFQAASKVVTTVDSMLEEIIRM